MRNSIRFMIAIVAAAIVMLLFRGVAFTIYTVPKTGIRPCVGEQVELWTTYWWGKVLSLQQMVSQTCRKRGAGGFQLSARHNKLRVQPSCTCSILYGRAGGYGNGEPQADNTAEEVSYG